MKIHRYLLTGEEKSSSKSGEISTICPADLEAEAILTEYAYSDIDLAVDGAKQLLQSHRRPSLSEIQNWIQGARETLLSSKDELYRWIALEAGRTEADFELEYTQSLRYLNELRLGVERIPLDHPRGLTAVIGSSIWPIFYSLQFTLANLMVGNPVILKPSERVSAAVWNWFHLLRAKNPAWEQVQILVGDREMGRRLACHEAVATVIFQGSFEVGMRVKQDTLSQPAKEVLLFLGAKNPYVVLESPTEAEMEILLRDAFLGTGQNCQSASLVFVKEKVSKKFITDLHERMKRFSIDGPAQNAFMGPLLDRAWMDRYFKFIGISEREGAQILMRGKALERSKKGHFVSPTLAIFDSLSPDQIRKSISLQTEILAPHLSVVQFKEDQDAADLLNRLSYGHSIAGLGFGEASQKDWLSALPFGRIRTRAGLFDFSPLASAPALKRSGNHGKLGQGLFESLGLRRLIE